MGRINSCVKGKVAERSWAEWLRENLDPKARRGFGQSAGGSCRPDVESSLPLHFECKHVEALNVYKAIDQAIRDCQPGKFPVVAHKKNRTPWHVTMLASDFIEICDIVSRAKRALEEKHQEV